MNGELERIWRGQLCSVIEVVFLYLHFRVGTENKHEILYPGQAMLWPNSNRSSWQYKSRALFLDQLFGKKVG
jgi:hypothetical protein